MNSYYPEVIKAIEEYQAIINSEYPEIELLGEKTDNVLENAYLITMNEFRINQWENILGIVPFPGSSLQDRREVIMARIKGQGKLNTALINTIVKTFTGGTAKSFVKDSVLYVEITPPPGDKHFIFENVEQELTIKKPAHLGLNVKRNYYTWGDIYNTYYDWADMQADLPTWEDVYLFIPFQN